MEKLNRKSFFRQNVVKRNGAGCLLAYLLLVFCQFSCEKEVGEEKKLPQADFTFTAKSKGNVEFVSTSKDATSLSWDFGDGTRASTENSPAHLYKTYGGYNVTLTAKNAEGESKVQKTVTVTPDDIKAAFSYQLLADGCVQLKNESTNANSVAWTFEKGSPATSSASNPKVCFAENGSYKISLKASGFGKAAIKEQIIKITNIKSSLLVADFTVKSEGNGRYSFKNTSQNALFSDWYIGDAREFKKVSEDVDLTYTFPSNNTFKVRLCVTSASSGPLCVEKTIVVNTIRPQNNQDRFIGDWISKHQCTDRAYNLPISITSGSSANTVKITFLLSNSSGTARIEGDSIFYSVRYDSLVGETLKGKINESGNRIDFFSSMLIGSTLNRCSGSYTRR